MTRLSRRHRTAIATPVIPAWRKGSICAVFAMLVFGQIALPGPVLAGEADVVKVVAKRTGEGTYAFSVTVRHADEGWDHYANVWHVLAPDGAVLGERILLHPHDNEQPFTRSLSGVSVPAGIDKVTIRAGDSVHQFGGMSIVVSLPGPS